MSQQGKSTEGRPGSQPGDERERSGEQVRHGTSSAPPFWKRRRFRTIVLCVGMFLTGACLGSFATTLFLHHHVRRFFRDPESVAERMLGHVREDLDLTDEQAEQILPHLVTLHRRVTETIRREHDTAMAEIEQYLTEEQIAEHRRIGKERRRHFSPPGSGPDHH